MINTSINVFSQSVNKKDDRKIIIIATLNNTYHNFINDSLFKIDSCLKLKFDTIYLSQLKKDEVVKGIKNTVDFEYKSICCINSQLFDINKKIDFKEYYIKSFCIVTTFGKNYFTTPVNNGSCFDDNMRNILKDYIHDFYTSKFYKNGKIWLANITVVSNDGIIFKINDILLKISKETK